MLILAAPCQKPAGASTCLPQSGTVFISVKDADKDAYIPICRDLAEMGFTILATGGTTDALMAAGVPATRINKVMEGRPHAVDAMLSGQIDLVFNTAHGGRGNQGQFFFAPDRPCQTPSLITPLSGSWAAAAAIAALKDQQLDVQSIQDYLPNQP